MKTTKNTLIVLFLTIGYLLVACSTQGQSLPTTTVTGVLLLSPTPSVQASQTFLPTAAPTKTLTPTWTPLPTLTLKQAREKINDLNSDNGGCQLPCWWGLIPGKATWNEALQLLAPFTEIKQGESRSFVENGKTHYVTNYTFYYKFPGETASQRLIIDVQDDLVIGFTIFPAKTEHNFTLSQILMYFGKPNQVYVSAQPDTQTNQLLPAIIVLDYGDKGIWASYEFPLSKTGENLKICPDSTGAKLELWNPKIKYSNKMLIAEYVTMITGFDPKILENVSKMNIASFYETYKSSGAVPCLETPINLWP